MPVRMRKDKNRGSGRDNYPGRNNNNRGSGGGSPLVYFIPIVMNLFKKNPKLMIILAVIVGGLYLFGGGCGGGSNENTTITNPDDYHPEENTNSGITDVVEGLFKTGWTENPKQFSNTAIFEPLADNIKNPLPEQFSLEEYAPKRRNQGKQGSCVAWASSYAARTILESRRTGQDPDQLAFSPSYLYNQIALPNCQGAYLPQAMKTMKQNGGLPFNEFRYDERSCSDKPDRTEVSEGARYSINGYTRLSKDDTRELDMLAIKQHVAQGAPVVIGMMVGGTFMQDMRGKEVWVPSKSDYDQRGFGGHAMCVIGYDDYKYGEEGAFEIMNSWGEEWGKDGICWVRYKDFDFFVKEAYGIFPMGNADEPSTTRLNASIDLIPNDGSSVSFRDAGNGIYTTNDLKVGDDFKMEIVNDHACNIYIFGEETDGSSYVLFPYTEKHSPFCGITGRRLFPRDYSMELDDLGNRDQIAVVITRDPMDFNQFNDRINQASGDYAQKLNTAMGVRAGTSSSASNEINLGIDLRTESTWGCVVAIEK